MMLIRPIAATDLDDLMQLAENTGIGVTTLPANRDLLKAKIERSEASFAKRLAKEKAFYLFALEDTEQQRVVGVSGIEAAVGLDDVWYNYRISTTVNSSKELGIHQHTPTLYLSNDMTGCSEVCSLFLDEPYRHSSNGRFLSKVRFLFMADFQDRFANKVFAEMRGVSDAQGLSPFWEGLGKHFFRMDFSEADYQTGIGNKSFIAELMPKYPIYLPFLGKAPQEVIGQVHENTKPALKMLESEGFNFNGFVDIFDAGPLVEVFVNNIRTVQQSSKRQVLIVNHPKAADESQLVMVSNRSFDGFRAAVIPQGWAQMDTVSLPAEVAKGLNVHSGDIVRISTLTKPKKK